MKCDICHGKTDWDSSYGREEFIVCGRCFDEMTERKIENYERVLDFIFKCGDLRRTRD